MSFAGRNALRRPPEEGVALTAPRLPRGATWLVAAIIVCAPLAAAQLHGQVMQAGPNAEQAEEAIDRLRSPYCPGFMLEVCTSSSAALLRDSIYDLAAEGMTADELVEWMIARHGEEWRAEPQRSGAGLWAWIVPPLGLVMGIGAILYWLRTHKREPEPAAMAQPAELSDDDRTKLASALRAWEDSGGEEP